MNKHVTPKQLELVAEEEMETVTDITVDERPAFPPGVEALYEEQNKFLATGGRQEEDDDFDWNTDDSIILREQRATAAYRNRLGELVIRQRCWPGDDTILFVSPENETTFLEGLAKRSRES